MIRRALLAVGVAALLLGAPQVSRLVGQAAAEPDPDSTHGTATLFADMYQGSRGVKPIGSAGMVTVAQADPGSGISLTVSDPAVTDGCYLLRDDTTGETVGSCAHLPDTPALFPHVMATVGHVPDVSIDEVAVTGAGLSVTVPATNGYFLLPGTLQGNFTLTWVAADGVVKQQAAHVA